MPEETKSPFSLGDGGWSSRKLWAAATTQVMILTGAVVSARWPSVQPVYATMVGALVSCLALFLGANVTGNHLTGLNLIKHAALGDSDGEQPADDSQKKIDPKVEEEK